jgi:hypothetical protein
MKDYLDADLNLLETLLDWNKKRGFEINIEVHRSKQQWAVSFYGCKGKENQSLIAQFTGESEAILNRWAKSVVWRYERRRKF